MGLLAVFGITNDGLNLVVSLLILFLAAIWLALVYWTYADAKRRIADPMLVGCATAAALFPYIGTIVYMIVRPPEYLEDMRERELEIAAAQARLAEADHLGCPYCGFEIERSFLRCPSCLRRLKEPCATCGKPLDPRWKICPYCEAEIAPAAAAQRRRAGPAAAGGKRAAARPQSAAATPKAAEQRARARPQAQAVPDKAAAATRRPRSS
jgi:double zinc ribbon protein